MRCGFVCWFVGLFLFYCVVSFVSLFFCVRLVSFLPFGFVFLWDSFCICLIHQFPETPPMVPVDHEAYAVRVDEAEAREEDYFFPARLINEAEKVAATQPEAVKGNRKTILDEI